MDLKRGNTSKSLLKMRWEFPVYEPPMPEDAEEGQTVARRPAEALPLEQAFAEVAEEDPRPLLILRECQACEGTEKALLRVDENNEKTLLLSKWFRCVKLPVHVLSEDHPFHAFWDEPLPDGRIPHLFFASPDGEIVIPLRGDQSQTELHGAMLEMLERFYKRNGEKRVREITKLLAKLDHYDFLEMAVNQRLDRAIENDGPDSRKARKLMKEKESIEQDRAELLEDYEELLELPLRKEPKT